MGKPLPPPPAYADAILDELEAVAERVEASKKSRVRLIQLGREAGIGWDPITERLGITRGAAIGLLQRAEK